MDLRVFEPEELLLVARALRGVAAADGAFTAAEAAVIEGVARLHGLDVDVASLEPVSPAELARNMPDPHRRKRAVQLAVVAAVAEGGPTEARSRAVGELARALAISEDGLRVLYELSHGHAMLARFDMVRRFGRALSARKNAPRFFDVLLPVLGLGGENPKLAARYRALGQRAPGTFGRAFYDHLSENGFAFPGEAHGLPEAGVFHDVGHVLSGYGVDPQGEIQQAAFQAGFSRRDGFAFLLFGILQFHLGVRITPIAKAQRGLFEVPRVLQAAVRGAACKVDLGEDFDLFAHADTPLESLRQTLGIPPLAAPEGAYFAQRTSFRSSTKIA